MVVEDELLARARQAQRRLGEAEKQALLAKAEYHAAVRRLHLGGGSLREIAQALSISHQRVQQIVQGAGGSWWQRVWRTRKVRPDAVCSFCGRPPSEVKKLVAGPAVYVCDGCAGEAQRAFQGRSSALAQGRGARCSFCGKRRSAARKVASAGSAGVCEACLATCRELMEAGG